MKHLKILVVALGVFIGLAKCRTEEEAAVKIAEINAKLIDEVQNVYQASWDFVSNITKYNEGKKNEAAAKYAQFLKTTAHELMEYNFESFEDETLKRQFRMMVLIGDSALDESDFNELTQAIGSMQSTYAKAKVPKFNNNSELMSLEPEITNILLTSKDPEELQYYWVQWHDLTGRTSRDNFFKYVGLRNKAAELNNFENGADYWLRQYEDPTFEKQIETILEQMRPLYLQLHGYVRHKLHEFYGSEHVNLSKPIPIHLLGNMWAQRWDIEDITIPYKNKQSVDVTAEMLAQGFTPEKMFRLSEDFFKSINLKPMPPSFWKKSILEKPKDGRDLICHASAWNFLKDDDVRIKQCTRVTMESLITVHHEMGHIEYYLHYNTLPYVFRNGANPGFHEAIGDTIALSVSTNRHLQRVGLLKNFKPDKETEINEIVLLGLSKLAFLPFSFVMDKFRWEAFRGNVKPEEANCYFWKLRDKYAGVEPSIVRTNRDFDITAKYHASADVEYLRYFVSFIIQFQFHKAACVKAGEYEPNNPSKTLNNCDIYQSDEAGNALKSMLAMGSSKPWPDALEAMTGQRNLDATDILEYFKPLEEWLLKTNKQLGVNIGWEPSDKIDCST